MHSHNYTLKQLYGRRFIEGEADAFIYARNESLPKAIIKMVGSIAKNWIACIRGGDFLDMLSTPARRAVFHWAYLRGHRHGERRIATNNTDSSVGQRTILSRHDSNRGDKASAE